MKRWLPFIGLLLIAAFAVAYMMLGQGDSIYVPTTDKADILYREACAGCHGRQGEGKHLFYPALAKEDMEEKDIRHIIQTGALMMPAFRNIKGDTLNALVQYVGKKRFIH